MYVKAVKLLLKVGKRVSVAICTIIVPDSEENLLLNNH